ncbi:MAG: glycosyltransferase [Burkholderiaceae bacterium]|nr:glycosyltransferase [Burkholderiaceae bacterium]
MQTLLVFSHLRWDFVYQRPQHLLSRLAKHYRVLFFEEPVRGNQTPFLQRIAPCANVEVLRPHTTIDAPGFHDDQLVELRPLIAEYLQDFSIDDYLVWFYTPMALPLLAELSPRAVIYDCMDELSAFKNAPRQMVQRESALIKRAHLVLTGGPSLYERKRDLHDNVFCFPSAVDAQHFARHANSSNGKAAGGSAPLTRLAATARAAAQAVHDVGAMNAEAERLHGTIAQPRLGFYGVIDERFDLALLSAVADGAPDWQFVMVGPVVKIDQAALPRKDNIHWLGQQSYEVLPALVAQWDVCLMPFALNESTRFISPTKTLEYMAAEKPIVSTAIHDVVSLYGESVAIAATADEFIAACGRALSESSGARQRRIEHMRTHVAQCSWDVTARKIRDEIEAVQHGEILQDQNIAAATLSVERLFKPVRGRVGETLRASAGDRATAEIAPAVAAQ